MCVTLDFYLPDWQTIVTPGKSVLVCEDRLLSSEREI